MHYGMIPFENVSDNQPINWLLSVWDQIASRKYLKVSIWSYKYEANLTNNKTKDKNSVKQQEHNEYNVWRLEIYHKLRSNQGGCIIPVNHWIETNLTMKDVRRVMKIRKRERTRALDEKEELETEKKITSLSNLKQELIEEQSKLQREVEMYRNMEFLNSPSDQQWMKQLLTYSNWQHWYEHSTITYICIAANCFLFILNCNKLSNHSIPYSALYINYEFVYSHTSAMHTTGIGETSKNVQSCIETV